MNFDTITAITSFFTVLFGGTSLWQFLFYRNEKRKKEAEAAALELENKSKMQEIRQNECDFSSDQMKKVSEELNRLQTDYIELFKQVQNHLKTIGDLQTTVNELKLENAYLKGIRCYKTSCGERIRNKKDIKEENHDINSSTTKEDSAAGNNGEH